MGLDTPPQQLVPARGRRVPEPDAPVGSAARVDLPVALPAAATILPAAALRPARRSRRSTSSATTTPRPTPTTATSPAVPLLSPADAAVPTAEEVAVPRQVERAVEPEAPAASAGPRVALGFRDGSTAELDPESETFLALEALAAELSSAD